MASAVQLSTSADEEYDSGVLLLPLKMGWHSIIQNTVCKEISFIELQLQKTNTKNDSWWQNFQTRSRSLEAFNSKSIFIFQFISYHITTTTTTTRVCACGGSVCKSLNLYVTQVFRMRVNVCACTSPSSLFLLFLFFQHISQEFTWGLEWWLTDWRLDL